MLHHACGPRAWGPGERARCVFHSSSSMPAAFRHAILLDTLSDAERRSVREQYTCRHQFDNINNSAEQPLVLLDCITKPPAMWRYDFVHTFVVAEDDIPPNVGRFGVDWEQYLQDGGATARQGLWVHNG